MTVYVQDRARSSATMDVDDSATLILKGLGCENLNEDVLELDVLSHFYQALASSYGRNTDGVHEALLTFKLVGGNDAKAISALAFKEFIRTRFLHQEDAISRLAAVATALDSQENTNVTNAGNNKTSDALTHLSPVKSRRPGESSHNVNKYGRNSGSGGTDVEAELGSYYHFSNVRSALKRKIARRSSREELVNRNVLKSPNLGRIDGRASIIELKLRKARLAKALAKRMLEHEVKPLKVNITGLVEKRKSVLEPLYTPRVPRDGGGASPPANEHQGEYAKQRSKVRDQGLDVDAVSGGISRD